LFVLCGLPFVGAQQSSSRSNCIRNIRTGREFINSYEKPRRHAHTTSPDVGALLTPSSRILRTYLRDIACMSSHSLGLTGAFSQGNLSLEYDAFRDAFADDVFTQQQGRGHPTYRTVVPVDLVSAKIEEALSFCPCLTPTSSLRYTAGHEYGH
jgi:hypothetical protein